MILLSNVKLAAILLLLPPVLYAQLPAKTNDINNPQDKNLIRFLQQSYYRQNNNESVIHSSQQHSSSFWNLLNTYGIGISAHLGAGIRVATSDNHSSSNTSRTPQPNTNSVWDRYLGSTLHVGLNTHLGNNKLGQDGASQQAHGGSLPIVTQVEDEKQLIQLMTPQTTYWTRIVSYLPWNRWNEPNCDFKSNVECNTSNNVFNRILTRFFRRQGNNEKHFSNETQVAHDSQNKTDTLNEYFKQFRRNNDTKQGWLHDFQTFANTVKQFFVDRFSSYVTQGVNNEQFLRKMIRISILNLTDGTELKVADGNINETDPILLENLSKYFTDETVRHLFPEVELLRLNLVSQNISNEDEYTRFNNN